MNGLSSVSPAGLTLLAVFIGFIAIASLDTDELNVIGNWIIGIGGIMVIASSQGDYIDGLKERKVREEILKKELALLREEFVSLSRKRTIVSK